MRRNETVLVYAVTGLLIVILGIAVIFGEEAAPGNSAGGEGARGLLDGNADEFGLPGVSRVNAEEPGKTEADPKPAKSSADVPKEAGKEAAGPVAREGAAADLNQPKAPAKGEAAAKVVPLVTDPTVSATLRVLGKSRREGQYRVVTARTDDRLSKLVERWCGNLDPLPTVEALNEDLKQGKPIPDGHEVLVPWTDDEVLLAAHTARQRMQAELERKQGELYTLKKGDSLWKIAVQRVGSRKAPAYIRAIAQRNPKLEDPNAVREGQKLRLPPVK